MSYDYKVIEKVDLCKYAKVISLEKTIECKYKNSPFDICPMDSGTDGKCNNKCADVYFKKIEE